MIYSRPYREEYRWQAGAALRFSSLPSSLLLLRPTFIDAIAQRVFLPPIRFSLHRVMPRPAQPLRHPGAPGASHAAVSPRLRCQYALSSLLLPPAEFFVFFFFFFFFLSPLACHAVFHAFSLFFFFPSFFLLFSPCCSMALAMNAAA